MPLPEAEPQSSHQTSPELARLLRAVKRQTVAIWCLLSLIALLWLGPWILFAFRSKLGAWSGNETPVATASSAPGEELPLYPEFDNDFHARPPEEQITRATAILLTRREQRGNRHVQVVSEIVKLAPGVRLYYNVGDEYVQLGHSVRADCDPECEGDGNVVLMLANPPTMATSMSHRSKRIPSFGDMPLDELRRLARAK